MLPMAMPVLAQPATPPQPVTRADVTGVVSWLAVEKDSLGPFNDDRWHHTIFGAAGAGWYWNDHLKTEVDLGVGRQSRHYGGRQTIVGGLPTFISTESTFSRRILGVSQQYQFDRNAWFHPHVAAGADITWERTIDVTGPIVIFDSRGQSQIVQPEQREDPRTEVRVRPFLATGFKAYITPRGFFRSDVRVGFRGGIDEVLVRFGFGIDF